MKGLQALALLARAGFLVKGVLYLVIGILAIQVAAATGGRVTGTRGALMVVLGQPFGRTLLLVAAIGLFGYAAWRVVQGVLDPERYGHGGTGLAMRSGFVVRGVMHAGLGWQALRLYRGLSTARGVSERSVARELLAWPFGDWVLVLAGLGLIGFAVQQIYAGFSGRLERGLDISQLRRDAGEWAVHVSRFGIAARAVVFLVLGWGAAVAGWFRDASEVNTTASSMRTLGAQPGSLGRWLLGIAAAGFIAYGFYQMVHARYLRIRLDA
ncbi:MAG: DUF1206 domain-containing protein [Vicinamibacteraceae bacterium]